MATLGKLTGKQATSNEAEATPPSRTQCEDRTESVEPVDTSAEKISNHPRKVRIWGAGARLSTGVVAAARGSIDELTQLATNLAERKLKKEARERLETRLQKMTERALTALKKVRP